MHAYIFVRMRQRSHLHSQPSSQTQPATPARLDSRPQILIGDPANAKMCVLLRQNLKVSTEFPNGHFGSSRREFCLGLKARVAGSLRRHVPQPWELRWKE